MISSTQKAKIIRNSSEYKEWRNAILKRDEHKCVLCGSCKKIEVDHIKSLALFPQLALDIDNGRVLCQKCHKKTDNYGGLTKFKGETPIHPLLSGDLLYKIQSLPYSLTIGKYTKGISIEYESNNKRWASGYKIKKLKLMTSGDTLEESVDNLLDILRKSSTYNYEKKLNIINEKTMDTKSTKLLKQGLYKYIEKLLNRSLEGEEKTEIIKMFKKAIRQYFENTYLNS